MIKRTFTINAVGEGALLTFQSKGVVLKISVSLIAPGVLNADVWTRDGEQLTTRSFTNGAGQKLAEMTEGIISIEAGGAGEETEGQWTLVDELLSVSQPVSATHWRQLHRKAMEFLRDTPVAIPDPSQPLPDGATLAERENWLMLRELNSRKSGEHYSSLMYRVYSIAKAVRSMRGDAVE